VELTPDRVGVGVFLSSNPRESGSPTPACETVLRADRAEWRDPEELTDGLAVFNDPCAACFPEGEPEIGTEIVRSTACSTPTYHRSADPDPKREADGGTEAAAVTPGPLRHVPVRPAFPR
jgi:hypothetical protein